MQKIQLTKHGQAIEYLMQYQYLKTNIQDKLEKAEIIKNKAKNTKMNLNTGNIQTSLKNKVEKLLIKSTNLEKSAKQDEAMLEKIKSETLLTLSKLKNPLERKVLELRYLECFLFVRIADNLDLSDEQIFRIHDNGVNHLAEML